MLRWRAATALVLAPIALASIALGNWAILLLLLVVIAGAAYEPLPRDGHPRRRHGRPAVGAVLARR